MPNNRAQVSLSFAASVYALTTLQKAAIKYTAVVSFDFRPEEDGTITVVVSELGTHAPTDFDDVVGRYKNEVLDQHLRGIVSRETEAERNLILSYTFSNTKLVRQ